MLTADLKKFAIKAGADTVGVAPISRFDPAPVGYNPKDLLPTTRNVIAFTVRQLAAYADSSPSNAYQTFGYIFKNIYLARIAWEIARFLDDRGYWALPYCREGQITLEASGRNPNPFFEGRYIKSKTKVRYKFRGDISMRHAAMQAGLGQIGMDNLLCTPEYGPRVRIGVVLTTAPLEPTPLIEKELCTHCMRCIKKCPAQALSEKGPDDFDPAICTKIQLRFDDKQLKDRIAWYTKWNERDRLLNEARRVVYYGWGGAGRCGPQCVQECPIGKRKMK